MKTRRIGERGEDAAAAYLERSGMKIVERNWRCRHGEVDIVCFDSDVLVLVEVKTRTTARAGTGEEAVSTQKQRKLTRLAREYVHTNGLHETPMRFDVIAIRVIASDRAMIRHHKDAFAIS